MAFGQAGTESAPSVRAGRFVLTLQTAALMADPRQLIQERDGRALRCAYADYFESIGNGSIVLDHFFAQQELQGGPYLYHRFQKGREGNQYEPYLVTQAGSVFVFSVGDRAKAEQLVGEWFRYGLPVPQWAIDRFTRGETQGDHWSNHPFHPDNGFGQIVVNHSVHFDKHAFGGPYA